MREDVGARGRVCVEACGRGDARMCVREDVCAWGRGGMCA